MGIQSEWTPGVGDGQGGLACCNSWGHKESDTTERLIWSDLIWGYRNRRETIKWWYSLETGSWFLLKNNMHNNVFEFFYRTGAPNQVEDGNFRLNTRFLEHSSVASPPTNQSHTAWSPHPKCCLLFLGTSDDHPVRSPVCPLFHLWKELTVSNYIAVITRVNAGFRRKNTLT